MGGHLLQLDRLTVVHVDANGEHHDMNAQGSPCRSRDELRAFVTELHEQGAYDPVTRDALLAELEAAAKGDLLSAAPDLLAAAEFALSVLKEQGLYDMSEKMAARKLQLAIAKARGL